MYLYLSRYCQILPQPFVYIEYAPPVYYLHLDKVHLISSARSLVSGLKVWFGLQDQQLTPKSSFLTHHEHVLLMWVYLKVLLLVALLRVEIFFNFWHFLMIFGLNHQEMQKNCEKISHTFKSVTNSQTFRY